MTVVNRGEVWWVDTPYGEKPYLVVSNLQRNRNLDTVIGVRITTSPKPPDLDTIVPVEARGHVVGRVMCDEITLISKLDLKRRASNAFTPSQMERICAGLKSALDCA